MPPVRYRPLLGIFPRQITWHVGSDDFTLPSLFAIVSRLILLSLTLGTQVYLLFPVSECEEDTATIPPLFYISLTVFNLVLFLTIVNEGVILSLSVRGRIKDVANTRKYFPYAVEVRIGLMLIEILTLIVTSVGTANNSVGGNAIECDRYREGPLVFAKVIISLAWVLVLVLVVALVIGIDPLGICSPSIFIDERQDSEELGKELDEEGFIVPGKIGSNDSTPGQRRKTFRVELGHRKIFRRFKALCCCITSSNRSSAVAMQDAAKALYTVFGDVDIVPSDVVAGLILLKRDQRLKRENCSCPVCLKHEEGSCEINTKDLRDLTFEYMPRVQIPKGYVRQKQRPFNFDDPHERALFEDVHHYMGYSMGMYGWTLHVFQNPLYGLLSLSCTTCCRCNYRCLNPRAGVDIVDDDMCLCGLATMKLQSKRPEEDIVYASYQNDIYQIPFSISVDHERKTVVLAIRGTLSMKDVLTDVSVTMVKVKIPGLQSDELYMHNGMYRTAQWIKGQVHTREKGESEVLTISESRENVITEDERTSPNDRGKRKSGGREKDKHILRMTMQKHWDYKLVVTGHSLGAGVASVLAVLLKPAYSHLHCYAYSPPGCIFSLPVSHHSESFITTTILGNDLVSRISFRSLLFTKKQLDHLVTHCQKPKPQVLFQGPKTEKLFSKVTKDPTVSLEDVKEHLIPDQRRLGIREIVFAKKLAKKAKRNLQRRRSLHVYVTNINNGDHIASFPPGRILHMEITRSAKPLFLGLCYPQQMKLTWKSFEDMSTIVVDKGMMEDHLPTAVTVGLQRITKQFIGRRYDPKETERIRINAYQEYLQRVTDLKGRREQSAEGGDDGSSGGVKDGNEGVNGIGNNGVNGMGNEGVDESTALGHNDGAAIKDRGTVEVAVTIEENRPHGDSSCPAHQHQELSNGAAAKASAFLEALGKPTKVDPAPDPAQHLEEIALEMEEML